MGKRRIAIRRWGLTTAKVDAIVYSANEDLSNDGSGGRLLIFYEAGEKELTEACKAIGGCRAGSAVITPAFDISSKYLIHAVTPKYDKENMKCYTQLYSTYKRALEIAKENECHSIAFSVLGTKDNGFPEKTSWHYGILASLSFLELNQEYQMKIMFVSISKTEIDIGRQVLARIESLYCIDSKLDRKCHDFCSKYVPMLELLYKDEELRAWCEHYNVYQPPKEHPAIEDMVYDSLMKEAYDEGIVIQDYSDVIKETKIEYKLRKDPTAEWIATLSKRQIVACIALQFREDYWNNGTLLSEGVGQGKLLRFMQGYLAKCCKKTADNPDKS